MTILPASVTPDLIEELALKLIRTDCAATLAEDVGLLLVDITAQAGYSPAASWAAGEAITAAIISRYHAMMNGGAPWHAFPADDCARHMVLLIAGLEDDPDEQEAVLEAYLARIEAELIRMGFSAKTAADWAGELSCHLGAVEYDISRQGGGHQPGHA